MDDLGERLVVGEVAESHGALRRSSVDAPALLARAFDRDLLDDRAVHHHLVLERFGLVATRLDDEVRRAGRRDGRSPRRSRPRSSRRPRARTPRRHPSSRRRREDARAGPPDSPRAPPSRMRSCSSGGCGAISERSRSTQSTRARSTWRKKSCPRPRPSAAPSMSPGMSAMTNSVASPGRADRAPTRTTPRFGSGS